MVSHENFSYCTVWFFFYNSIISNEFSFRNENPGFKRTVEKLERSPICQRLPLRSFLVLPFQRITRIKLLVQVCFTVCVCMCCWLFIGHYCTIWPSLTHPHSFCPEHCEENYSRYCRGDSGNQIFKTSGEGTALKHKINIYSTADTR